MSIHGAAIGIQLSERAQRESSGQENGASEQAISGTLANLVHAHARLLYRIAFSILRNHHDAEDAVQETFAKVWRTRDRLSSVEDPRLWLIRVAWRVAIDKHRARRSGLLSSGLLSEDSFEFETLAGTGPDCEEALLTKEQLAIVESVIAGLPDKQRTALALSTVDELSNPEIAAALKISEASVRARIFRARQLLRQRLRALMERKK